MNNFSNLNRLAALGLILALLFTALPYAAQSQVQCNLACNDLITIKIPVGGTVEFLPELMLEGDPGISCPNGVLNGQAYIANTWQPANGNYVFDHSQVGTVFQARVRDSNSGNSCWGNIQILEDNQQNDTVHFKLCSELWKDHRPVKGTFLKFQPHNSAFPYNPWLFQLDSDHHCVDLTVVPSDYLAGTTFEYGAELPNTNHRNGVDFIDLCQISEHILGINALPPYAMYAGDANKSNSLTAFDIVESRKLIMGIYTEFPNNLSWRTIPDYCTFPNPSNPYQISCPSGISLSELQALDGDTARAICIKIGDVSGDVLLPGETYVTPPSIDSFGLILPEATLMPGVPIKIPVKFSKSFSFKNLQLNFFLDGAVAKFDSISDGSLDVTSDNDSYFNSSNSRLAVSRASIDLLDYQSGTAMFYIHLHPLQLADLQASLKLMTSNPQEKSFILGQHCSDYNKLGAEYSGIVATQTPEMKGVQIIPPSPNPFAGESTMQITLESAEEAKLELFDAEGRLLARETRHLPAGVSQWVLPAERIPGGSFGIWQLSLAGGRAQGKFFKHQN